MTVIAVQHVRRLRGGSQAHLMRCSDDHLYVVKFQNNPQHLRILTNEMLATRLAEKIGLPVPSTSIVEVDEWLIEHTPELHVQGDHSCVKCVPGSQFGSRYVVNPHRGRVFDYMPSDQLGRVRNLRDFAGILVFDKWTGNADSRQAAFWRMDRQRKYTVTFLDQGYCFNAGEWTFPDFPLTGVFARNEVYEEIDGWKRFEPWLSRIEVIHEDEIWEIANEIPVAWFGADLPALKKLIQDLTNRRGVLRDLIEAFRRSPRRPFPAWLQGKFAPTSVPRREKVRAS